MQWLQRSSADPTVFEAEAVDASPEQRETSAAELWTVLESKILPLHTREDWDVLRLEVWSDSARTIVFPAKLPFLELTENALLDLHWPALQELWDRRDQGGARDDDAFDAQVGDVVNAMVAALSATFARSSLRGIARVDCYLFGEELLCSLE